MTDNDKTYRPEDDEDALEFIHRVITEQPDRVDYAPDGEGTWELIIHRDIPPLFVTRR